MYIAYSKLWKLLIDKGISKTDLMELTGMSSRVLAKLSKNETVTTDTVARICSALMMLAMKGKVKPTCCKVLPL